MVAPGREPLPDAPGLRAPVPSSSWCWRERSLRTPDGARWRLVVSDLHGTLVTGTTALQHLAEWMGHGPAIEGVEERLALGGVSDREVAQAHAPSYRGIAVADAVEAAARIPSIGGIAEGVALLRQRSVEACIATVSWRFAAQALADRAGFTHVRGAELEVDGRGSFTGRVARPDCQFCWCSRVTGRAADELPLRPYDALPRSPSATKTTCRTRPVRRSSRGSAPAVQSGPAAGAADMAPRPPQRGLLLRGDCSIPPAPSSGRRVRRCRSTVQVWRRSRAPTVCSCSPSSRPCVPSSVGCCSRSSSGPSRWCSRSRSSGTWRSGGAVRRR